MKVSKIVPVIVSIVLVLAWGLIGYKSALISESLPADPTFLLEVTLKEDIYAINEFDYLGAMIDQRTNEPVFHIAIGMISLMILKQIFFASEYILRWTG